MKTILFNNKFIKETEAKVSIFSDSFARGFGIFETFRTFENKKLFLEKNHISRLLTSAKKINLKIKYSASEILAMLKKVVKKSPHKIQRIKITAIKEGIYITSTKYSDIPELYKKGVSCKTIICKRSLPDIKSISYISSFLCNENAKSEGFYDAIMLDDNGEVYECAYGNIFWFENDKLCTRKNDVLPGITANFIMKISPYKIKFKKITIKNLIKKPEVFLTQSTRGIVPIVRINTTKIGSGKPGKKTLYLHRFLKTIQPKIITATATKAQVISI